MINQTHFGDCREQMKLMIDQGVKVQTCVTSPPYYGLRNYGCDGQLGLEDSVDQYVGNLVDVFSLVWEILEDDGTVWLNLGDSYAGSGKGSVDNSPVQSTNKGSYTAAKGYTVPDGLKPKDLIGVPWRVAFELQSFGWYLRQDIIWAKPNPMPESVKDRCTSAHEHIFLLSKQPKYYFDNQAIKEQAVYVGLVGQDGSGYKDARKFNGKHSDKQRGHSRRHAGFNERWDKMTRAEQSENGRNKRNVWTVATKPYSGAHFATYPPELVEPCILAGSRSGDIVLDPFMGSGTTAQVAQNLGRQWIGCELNSEYGDLQKQRTNQMAIAL